eukprot:scaffold1418_cov64-Cylindrotheca_fusiformis.AAC.1
MGHINYGMLKDDIGMTNHRVEMFKFDVILPPSAKNKTKKECIHRERNFWQRTQGLVGWDKMARTTTIKTTAADWNRIQKRLGNGEQARHQHQS